MTEIQTDPWAGIDAAADEPLPFSEPDIKPAPKVTVVGDEGNGKIVLTFKEGAGFDASWTVVHADSVADATSILSDPAFKGVLEQAKKVAAFFRGGAIAAPKQGGAPTRPGSEAPASAGQAPGPGWTYREGSKNGKTWKAWMPPQGSDEKPVWVKTD